MVEGPNLFPTMIRELQQAVNVLREWPHDGSRLAIQFFELYDTGRRGVRTRLHVRSATDRPRGTAAGVSCCEHFGGRAY